MKLNIQMKYYYKKHTQSYKSCVSIIEQLTSKVFSTNLLAIPPLYAVKIFKR